MNYIFQLNCNLFKIVKIILRESYFFQVNFSIFCKSNSNYFSLASVPFSCFVLEEIRGFVEELIMADDPEYDWVDNFRASRSSNQGRQLFLYSLSGYNFFLINFYSFVIF